MIRIQSVERRNGQLASVLWDACGIIASITSKRARPSTSVIGAFKRLDEIKKKTAPFEEKNCCFIKTIHCIIKIA
jgi:hypothetical protein